MALLQLLMPYRIATVHGVRVCAPAPADGEASCLQTSFASILWEIRLLLSNGFIPLEGSRLQEAQLHLR
jgi:hypothetical protein